MHRHPQLLGLACLHCQALYPVVMRHEGCPVCAAQGRFVSLAASYMRCAGQYEYQPYTLPFGLGEGDTPLTDCAALAKQFGIARLSIKDESSNPTGSHKDRMSAIGVTQALDSGAHTVVLASSGNAAISAARFAQAAGLACEVAVYAGMTQPYVDALDACRAVRFAFEDNAARWSFVAQRAALLGYFALTNYHMPALGSAPLAIEGYKPIAYECYTSGCVPEHVVVPTARGDLAWGIFAGFKELLQAGKIAVLPKIWVVEPFARLSKALAGAGLHASFQGHTAQFSTAGTTVTYLQWQAATASGGGAVVVPDAQAHTARQQLMAHGYSAELCAGAALAAIAQLRLTQALQAHAHVLLVLTASALRDPSFPDLI